jgi:hypothetical protein
MDDKHNDNYQLGTDSGDQEETDKDLDVEDVTPVSQMKPTEDSGGGQAHKDSDVGDVTHVPPLKPTGSTSLLPLVSVAESGGGQAEKGGEGGGGHEAIIRRKKVAVMQELENGVRKAISNKKKTIKSKNNVALALRAQNECEYFLRATDPKLIFVDDPRMAVETRTRLLTHQLGKSVDNDSVLSIFAATFQCSISVTELHTTRVSKQEWLPKSSAGSDVCLELFLFDGIYYASSSTELESFEAAIQSKYVVDVKYVDNDEQQKLKVAVKQTDTSGVLDLCACMEPLAQLCLWKNHMTTSFYNMKLLPGTVIIPKESEKMDPLYLNAKRNWGKIASACPVELACYTEINMMGTTSFGTLYKAILIVKRHGCLSK